MSVSQAEDLNAIQMQSWRSAFVCLTLCLIGGVINIAANYKVPGYTYWQGGLLILVSAFGLVILYLRRKSCSVTLSITFYLSGVAAALISVGVTYWQLATIDWPFNPFTALKIFALAFGLLSPPRAWVGGVVVTSFGLLAVLEYYLWPGVAAEASVQEPWITIAAVFATAGFLVKKRQDDQIEIDLAREHAKGAALGQQMRTFLMVKDWVNTPIQTLVLSVIMMEKREPRVVEFTSPMKSAIETFTTTGKLLQAQGTDIAWPTDATSFDSKQALPRLLRSPSVARSFRQEETAHYQQSWRLASWYAAMAFVAMSLLGYRNTQIPGVTSWQTYVGLILNALAFVILMMDRQSQRMRVVCGCFLTVVISVLLPPLVNQLQFARAGVNFVPYEGIKVLLVLWGLFAPTVPWVGVSAIFMTTVVSEVGFLLLPPATQALSVREPWLILTGAIVGLTLFWRRLRLHELRRKLAFERAGNETMCKTQQTLAEVRAPVSESLQTLWQWVAHIEKEFPELSQQTHTVKNSLERLTELQKLIAEKEPST